MTNFLSKSACGCGLILIFTGLLLLTSPTPATAFRIAAAGDISCPAEATARNAINPGEPMPSPARAKCQGRRVAQVIAGENPEIVLALGDLIQGQTSEVTAYDDFNLAWGLLGERIAATVGNHDYYRDSFGRNTAAGYFAYWMRQGAPVWRYGQPNLGWSSWDRGEWHMVNLNSNCSMINCSLTGRQLKWLTDDLESNRARRQTKCVLAYFHHPLFSAGVARGRVPSGSLLPNLWKVLHQYRTDLVLNGHQHFYERFRPQNPSGFPDPTGITEIIAGTGGSSTFRVTDESGGLASNSAASYRGLGALILDLDAGSYSSYFRDIQGGIHDQQPKTRCNASNPA
ncbi:MAG: metallophosphoesterase family protein [Solirubrobacterales bacterium]